MKLRPIYETLKQELGYNDIRLALCLWPKRVLCITLLLDYY